jgi:hypothetical protein
LGQVVLPTLVVLTTRAADFPTTIQSLNPLVYYRFNETTASPAPPVATNSSPLGSLGTGYLVNATPGEPGMVGNCVRFYNTNADWTVCPTKVDVSSSVAFNPDPPFSIEFWAKPNLFVANDSVGGSPVTSMADYYFQGNRSGYMFCCNDAGAWTFRLGNENGFNVQVNATSGNATTGVWQYVVGVYDGTNATLYVNGQNVGTTVTPAENPFNANRWAPLRFGGSTVPTTSDAGGSRGWDGWVDEVAIYPRTLDGNTIVAHFSAATTNNAGYHAQILADNPVGYWDLDEPAYTPPDPSAYPTAANSGTLGPAAIGTNTLGVLAAQNVLPYAGLGSGNLACTFNGTLGNVALPNPGALSNLVGQVTLMAWIKPFAIGTWRDIISHGYDNNYAETYLRIGNTHDWENLGNPDTAYYEVGATADGLNYSTALYPVPAGDIGNWVFLAGTWDGANWNLYRDGQLVAQAPDTAGPVAVTNEWSIGSRSDPDDFFGMRFAGSLDEVAIFTNALSASTIRALYLSANVPPVLTQSPQLPSGPVYDGDSFTLAASAEGNPPLAYQWTKDYMNLPGQTGTSLTLDNVSTADVGTYSVIVTNNFGSVTGSVFFSVTHSAPTIVAQPVSETRWSSFPFELSVAATGSKPLTYQWTLGGTNLNGANASSYLSAASVSHAGDYACVLTNNYGATTTSVATLRVLAIPPGYAATVLADAPIAYYRLDEAGGSAAHDYVGGIDGTYFNAALSQSGYSVIDPDTAVAVNNQNSYVGNISGTAINFQGTNHSSFSLELWANGSSDQFEGAALMAKGFGIYGGPNEQFCIDISGGNYRFFSRAFQGDYGSVPNYQVLALVGPDSGWHHIVGVYDSLANQLYLYVDGALAGQGNGPAGGPLASSQPVSFGSERSGIVFNYDLNFRGLLDEVAIYDKPLNPAQIAGHYQAAYGPNLKPFLAVEPASITNYVTLNASFEVIAAGSTPLGYLWTKNGSGLSDGGTVSGSSTRTLTIANLALTDFGGYACIVTNAVGSITSAVAHLTVLLPPTSPPAIAGLVLHLPLDNNLTDVTGRGNNGTAVGAPTFVPDGVLGQALHYSTSTSNNVSGNPVTEADYVTLGVRPDLQFSSNISFSVVYWARLPANYIAGDLPFFTDSTNSTTNPGFAFSPSYGQTALTGTSTPWPGGWAVSIFDFSNLGIEVYGDIGSINDGDWHHLVHSVDRAVGAVTYLDGLRSHQNVQQGVSATSAGNIDTGAPANIGQDPTGQYSEPGSADIDDLGVWRKALTPLEAASIYMAALSNHLSYVGAPITLTVQRSGSQIHLSWPAGMLQSADSVNGSYTDVTPIFPLTLSPAGVAAFYRVRL